MRTIKLLFFVGILSVGLAGCVDEVPGVQAECRPSCTGKTCGDDGCGNSCGTCEAGVGCVDNRCVDLSICSDGTVNGEETDVDCGGRVCDPCGLGKSCQAPTDCASGHCDEFVCVEAPTCDDEKKNGGESDVDCGGGECDPCATGASCVVSTDCLTGICTNGDCRDPSCDDGILNQDESDVDCGGSVCGPCQTTKVCIDAGDCASGLCLGSVCQAAPSCADGEKNGDESDVDCGGLACAPCQTTKACNDASDCVSGLCSDSVCVPHPMCLDEVKNGDESDVDCGGTLCDWCATGRFCNGAADCLSNICTNGVCRDPSCFDGIKNQNETDVDCGGVCELKCAVEDGCRVNGDCDSNVCDGGKCALCQSTCFEEGASRCDGDNAQTCLATGSGCFEWSAATSCGSGRVCDPTAGRCVNTGCGDVSAEGRCLNGATVEYCAVSPADGTSFVREVECGPYEQCQDASGHPKCVLQGEACREGDTSCLGSDKLRTCVDGSWQLSACASGCNGSNPFESFCNSSQQAASFSGKLSYAARAPNAERSDWGTATQKPASGFLVVSMTAEVGTNELKPFDATFTKDADGTFTLRVPANAGVDDQIVVFAAGVGANAAHRYAVADPGFDVGGQHRVGALGSEPRVWRWSWRLGDVPGDHALFIGEQQGSGAARVFDGMRAGFAKAESVYPGKTGKSLLGWVGYDSRWDCETCFAPWPQALSNDSYQSQLWVSAGADQSYWDQSRTLHELGHWLMASYGTPPNETGPQLPGVPTFPGQAWSEGFATWFSSLVRADPVSASKRDGQMSWFDIATRQHSAQSWQRPNPGDGLLQKMDSNEVAAMLWALGTANETRLFEALAAPRMNTAPWYRGYTRHTWKMTEAGTHTSVVKTDASRPSLPDFFDTLMCAGFSATTMDLATQASTAYPYSSSERGMCSSGCTSGNCDGCCQDNTCHAGTELAFCGGNGLQCVGCGVGQACSGGQCVCNPASCPSGCCAGNTCAAGTINTQCGSNGLSCVSCGTGNACENQICKGGAGTACSSSQDCASGSICDMVTSPEYCRQTCDPGTCGAGFNCVPSGDSHACVPKPADGSLWKVRFDRAIVRENDTSGGNWDPLGAAPDPYLCLIFLPSETKICSSRRNTTRTPVWNETSSNSYAYSSFANVRIELWDYDSTSADDLMLKSAPSNVQPRRPGWPTTYVVGHAPHPTNGVELVEFTIVPVP